VCENPTQEKVPSSASSASRKSSYDSTGNSELKDEDSSEDDCDVDVTGLGDDTKLPFQVRLLTEASKQNFQSHKFMSSNLGAAAAYAQFSKHQESSSFVPHQHHRHQFHPSSTEQKPFFGLSDYMYMDKAHVIHAKSNEIQKVHSGFSIDEIMKR
jgi:hypothetical protein